MRLTTPRNPSIAISPRLGRASLRPGSRRGSTSSSARRQKHQLFALRALWLFVVFLGEWYFFWRRIHGCAWPTRAQGPAPYRLLVVSDPQIPDHRSYPGRPLLLQWLGQAVIDNFLRKSWRLVARQRPDAVVFNGDLLDSGHQASDRLEHAGYVRRFRSIFPSLGPDVPILHFPGNHDVGLHLPSAQAAHAREQFRDAFGPLNGKRDLGNHTILWVDSMSLLEDRARGEKGQALDEIAIQPDGGFAFVRSLANEPQPLPRILFSHIPLYRAPGTSCGRVRESRRPIREGRGLNYQNLVDEDTSKWLLEQTTPEVVFSGDDHDACIVKHSLNSAASYTSSVTEHTVRSFAMNMGVDHPGYELVSLWPAGKPSEPTYEAISCILPTQIGIYLHWYIPLLLLTLALILFPKLQRFLRRSRTLRSGSARSNGLPVHTRTPSFLDYGNGDASALYSDDEGDDGMAYVHSPMASAGPQYSYHAGATDDDMPTSATEPVHTSPRKPRRPSASRVRRVSRVWLWDGRSHEGRDTWANAPPFVRAARRAALRLLVLAGKLLRPLMLNDVARELWAVAWPALTFAVVFYVWYW